MPKAFRLLLLLACLLLPAAAARAAGPPPAAPELDRLIESIENEGKRAQLLTDLKNLRAAAGAAAPPAPPPADEPLATYLLAQVIDRVQAIVGRINAAAHALGDADRLTDWVTVMTTEPERRNLLLTAIGQLALLLAIGVAVAWAVDRLIRSPLRSLESRPDPGTAARLAISAGRLVLGLLPLAALVLAISLAQAWLEPAPRTRVLAADAVNAIVIASGANVVLRAVLAPIVTTARVVPLGDMAAAYVYIWLRRFVLLGVYGFFVLEGLRHLGMPEPAYELLLNLYGLALAGLAVVVIQQNKGQIAALVRGRDGAASRRLGNLRARFADLWHVCALFYIAALYVIWALEVKGGFELMVRGTLISIIIILLAWGASRIALAGLDRVLAVNKELIARNPFLERRTDLYLPLIEKGTIWVIRVLAALAILSAWRIDVAGLLASDTARFLWGRLIGILFVAAIAVIAWEMISGLVTSYLARRDADGNLLVRGARARTLLPLFNNALRVVIGLVAALMILSQLGIDIAPLLAGAGVVGLAIGFGSQKLVQDVITGTFLLFEDAVNVGDVININGTIGTVEVLTIRAVWLRDEEGTLHTIPFGSINQVSNLTRTFSYAVQDFTLPSEAELDRAVDAVDKAFLDLKGDSSIAPDILHDAEVRTVERFGAGGLSLQIRIRTRPGRQWGVKRAFNRAIARRFTEAEVKLA
jgi:small conductance mechanosensitive channel